MKIQYDNRGITLIEALLAVGLVSLLAMSIYAAISGAAINMSDAKQRTGAISLANERMEVLRHLPYDDVGTVDNALGPDGPIDPDEVIQRNGNSFRVVTDIRYKDDPFDSTGGDDPVNTDYKLASVRVIWQNRGNEKYVDLNSTFIPNGIETNVGGGTLSINVTDSAGNPVPNFTANIVSVDNNPALNVTVTSDATGNLTFPGTSAQTYRVTITKSGYETVRTYPNPPDSDFQPINSDLVVIEGALTMKAFTLDQSADLEIQAVDVSNDSGLGGIMFDLAGGRQIGTDPDTYSVDSSLPTNSGGDINYTGLSPGQYDIGNVEELDSEQYYYLGCDADIPFELISGESKVANFLFADKQIDSIVFRVIDVATTLPLSNVEIHVTSSSGFDQTVSTDSNGIAYFPPSAEPLIVMTPEQYQYSTNIAGYQSESGTVDVNNLVVEDVSLTLIE